MTHIDIDCTLVRQTFQHIPNPSLLVSNYTINKVTVVAFIRNNHVTQNSVLETVLQLRKLLVLVICTCTTSGCNRLKSPAELFCAFCLASSIDDVLKVGLQQFQNVASLESAERTERCLLH